MEYKERTEPSDVQASGGAHFCPFPASQHRNLYPRFWDLGALLSNYAIKKTLVNVMDYAHANVQSFPSSRHKVTKLRSQYCSVNRLDLSWACTPSDCAQFLLHSECLLV